MNDRLLIVGSDGLLGSALRLHCVASGIAHVGTSRRPAVGASETLPLDLAQLASDWPKFSSYKSAVLCAGITNLEQCRNNPALTRHINVSQTISLAQRLVDAGVFTVFISTNLVFDGSRPLRSAPEPTCPATEYGRQKAEVEKALCALGKQAAIVRLTKVIHPQMPLVQGWKNELAKGQIIAPFDDLVFAPISIEATVHAILNIARKQLPGVWHLSSDADISYADMARQIATLHQLDVNLIRQTSCRTRKNLEHVPTHTTLDASGSAAEIGFHIKTPADTIRETFTS